MDVSLCKSWNIILCLKNDDLHFEQLYSAVIDFRGPTFSANPIQFKNPERTEDFCLLNPNVVELIL